MKPALCALFLLFSVTAIVSQPQSACCRLDVTTVPSKPSELVVNITNVGAQAVVVRRTRPEFDIRVTIVSSDGKTPKLTDYGKKVSDIDEHGGSALHKELVKGEIFSQTLDLSTLYILTPGTYAIALKRDVFVGDQRIELESKITMKIP